ncbi:MAG: hypothetical protein U9R72_05755 [Chloroflexota bacterium]|nr:hypothetical protein [Chloroflexota bacterium]
MVKRLLCHETWYVRSLSLLGLATALFVLAWTLSYYLLPEGILRSRSGAAVLAGEEAAASFALEFLRIAAINLAMMGVVVFANRLLRVQGYPLGYLLPLMSYAVTLGTNSFSIPLRERMAPSFQVLRRSGPYEIAAYVLAAATTYGISANRFKRLIPPDSEPIEPTPEFARNADWSGLGFGVALLLAANAYEAYMILSLA